MYSELVKQLRETKSRSKHDLLHQAADAIERLSQRWISVKDRLPEYEKRVLAPEEIERILDAYGRGMTLRQENGERLRLIRNIRTDRLQKLVLAYESGRFVVLPCKAGDTVYVTDLRKGEAVPCEVLCYSALDGTGNGIIEYKVPREIPDIVSVEASMEEIGKTVFLTKEEAERAIAADINVGSKEEVVI